MGASVEYVDHGAAALFERMRELSEHELTIGFQGASGAAIHPLADVPVATVALYDEFGTINAPARGFLRSAVFEGRDAIVAAYASECAKVIAGKLSSVAALSAIGHVCAELVRKRIDDAPGWAVANAASTVRRKGHSRPLLGGDVAKGIAGGTMRAAVSWAVRKGGAIVVEGT